MVLYGIALAPLIDPLCNTEPDLVQPFFADDGALCGPSQAVGWAMHFLQEHGPTHGYFPEPEKSYIICRDSHLAVAQQNLLDFSLRYSNGQRYLGGLLSWHLGRQILQLA